MFSSPLLSTRNQNELFVFVRVFSSLGVERPPPFRLALIGAPVSNQILRLMSGSRGKTPCRNTWELWLEASSAANHKPRRPRSKTRTPPLARRRRSGHIGERVTPSQLRAGGHAESFRALSRRDGRDSRGGPPALYMYRACDSVARHIHATPGGSDRDCLRARVGCGASLAPPCKFVAGRVPSAKGPAHLLLESSKGGRKMVMVS